MARAVASMSDRIDDLTAVVDKQIKVATEARIAAFAARDQTNLKKYGDLLGQTLDSHLGATADAITEIVKGLAVQTDKTIGALARSEDDRSRAYREVFKREQKADRLKSCLPWFDLGALVLALVLTVPSFLARNASTCAVLGASWTMATTGVDACVFYR
tara:strand:+ start:3175 stop:3651 length:477 start_codon:yes stop_codon:yes gene_type:complete